MKLRNLEARSGFVQNLNHVSSKLFNNRFLFFFVPKIFSFEPIDSDIFIIHQNLAQVKFTELRMKFFPKCIVFDFFFIIRILHTDSVLIFHLVVLMFHETRNEFGLLLKLLSDIESLVNKKFLFLLVQLFLVSIVGPNESN